MAKKEREGKARSFPPTFILRVWWMSAASSPFHHCSSMLFLPIQTPGLEKREVEDKVTLPGRRRCRPTGQLWQQGLGRGRARRPGSRARGLPPPRRAALPGGTPGAAPRGSAAFVLRPHPAARAGQARSPRRCAGKGVRWGRAAAANRPLSRRRYSSPRAPGAGARGRGSAHRPRTAQAPTRRPRGRREL